MELEQAIDFINAALVAREGKSLTDAEVAIVTGAWQGQTYGAIAQASGYTLSYLSTDAGPVFWRRLSQVLGEKITKTNFRSAIARHRRQAERMQATPLLHSSTLPPTHSSTPPPTPTALHTDWGEIADVSQFSGRTHELDTLQHWLADGCRLIALLGIGGVGKSSLAAKLSQQVAETPSERVEAGSAQPPFAPFTHIIWRSLRNAPPLDTLLTDLILFLSNQDDTQTDPKRLLHWFRTHRCLVILDNGETILQAGDRAGSYRPGYENYGELLTLIGESAHQSCLVLTSREKPAEVAIMEGMELGVRSLQLSGASDVARAILQAKGINGTDEQQQRLCDRYSNNPLALKIVASSIQDLFEGDITPFVEQDTFLFNGLRRLLEQQFERLSYLEQSVMYWLAINREWTSITELEEDIVPPVSRARLLEVLESLSWRSLIEKQSGQYTQQPVVMEYVSDRLIEKISTELVTGKLVFFNHYALIKTTVKDYIRESQNRLILGAIAQRFQSTFTDTALLHQQIIRCLETLRRSDTLISGYGAGNLINFSCHLQLDLSGYDFSELSIWQADLQHINGQQINFSGSDFRKTVFSQIFGSLMAIAVSSDGTLLAAADKNGEIHLWKMSDGQRILTFKGHPTAAWSVAFSPNGQILASCGEESSIRLWDISTGRLLRVLDRHQTTVWSLAFAPTGQVLVSGSEDLTVRVWDVETGTLLKTLQGHTGRVLTVAVSPDGQMIASGSTDASIRVWHLVTGELLSTLHGHTGSVWSVAFSPDKPSTSSEPHDLLIVSSSTDQTIRLWNLTSAMSCQTMSCQTWWGHSGSIWSVAFSPAGEVVASGGEDGSIRLWDVATGHPLKMFRGHDSWVTSVCFGQNEQTLVSGSLDQTIRIWDIQTSQSLKTFRGYINWAQSAVFAWFDSMQWLVTGHTDYTVKVWNVATGQLAQTLKGHTQGIRAIAFDPVSELLATGSDDTTVKLWDITTGQCLRTFKGHRHWVRSVAFNPTQPILASASNDQTICLWDVETGQIRHILDDHLQWVTSVAFSSDGQWLASGSDDHTVRLWNAKTGEMIQVFRGHTHWVWSVAFSPNGQILASGCEDGTIRLWSVFVGETIAILAGADQHTSSVTSVAFSPDGHYLVSGSNDQTIRVWNVQTGSLIRVLEGHSDWIWAIAFDCHHTFASTSKDQTIRVWDVETGACLNVMTSDRPYEGMNITGATGLTPAQQASLKVLGAVVME